MAPGMRYALSPLVAVVLFGCTTVPGNGGAGGQSGSTSTFNVSGSGGMSSSSSTTTTSSSVTTTTSTSTGMPVCDLTEGVAVQADCGVFVQAGATGGNGTQTTPYGSIGEALTMHAGESISIYICGDDTFDETIALGGSSLYGGLACTSWAFSSSNGRPRVRGPMDVISVTSISSGNRVIDSIIIESPPGGAKGASSIALLASDGSLLIARASIIAGKGAQGQAGADGGLQGAASMGGLTGKNACGITNPTPGGAAISQTCGGVAAASLGGNGGNGLNSSGSDGSPGFSGALGQKGLGEILVGWSCGVDGSGHAGADGSPGMVGLSGTGKGVLDSMGFTPSTAGDGGPGVDGQGGGGGGGAKGPADCNSGMAGNQAGPGASGGSGGAGGCGGLPGAGGGGGGSSFAIVALNVSLSFSGNTSVVSAQAGAGGDGGVPQPGSSGGLGALGGSGLNGSKSACRGGDGGLGGNGGGGGGGRGGHSAAIVFLGSPPGTSGVALSSPPPEAFGGVGQGNGAVGGNNGMSGESCRILDFMGATCTL
jgi:hypothetical protein